MDKKLFENNFLECLNQNFEKYSKYLKYRYKVFHELTIPVFQVTKCLILELNYATITLTNNILERLLKIALISKETGIKYIPIEELNTIFEAAHIKYGTVTLGNSIELCKKYNLIDQSEKDMLFDTIRELMRNGFSHADPSKILVSIPDEQLLYQTSLTNPTEIKPIKLNPKVIPELQAIQIENFAKAHAFKYFDYVFKLIENIENRLIELNKE